MTETPVVIRVQSVPSGASGTTQQNNTESLSRFVHTGDVVNVEVHQNPQGQLGLFVQGRFYPAVLPESYASGTRLTVQVAQTEGVVVLKVLAELKALDAGTESLELRALLQALLPNTDFEALRQIGIPIKFSLPEPNGKALPEALTRALAKLIEQNLLAGGKNLSSSDALENLLKNITQNSIAAGAKDAKDALRQVEQHSLPPQYLLLAKSLEVEFERLLKQETPLSFDKLPIDPEAGQSQEKTALQEKLKFYLAASRFALESGEKNADLNPSRLDLTVKGTELYALLKNLSSLSDLDTPTSPQGQKLAELVKNFTSVLQALKQSNAPDNEVRSAISKMLSELKASFQKELLNATEAPRVQTTMNALSDVGKLMTGQNVLNNLNPLMRFLGEPTLILIPSMAHGLFSKWEMTVSPGEVNSVDDEDGTKKRSETFERIQLFLPFPSLGTVEVDLAHRADEIFMNLTFEREEVTLFIREKIPLLDATLKDLGFTKRALAALTGTPTEITPSWYEKLVHEERVA